MQRLVPLQYGPWQAVGHRHTKDLVAEADAAGALADGRQSEANAPLCVQPSVLAASPGTGSGGAITDSGESDRLAAMWWAMPKRRPPVNLVQVCEIIELPPEVRAAVLAAEFLPEVEQAERYKAQLADRSTWEGAVKAIAATLGDDADGMKMLAFMLLRAVETHERYVALGIDDTVFADTMKFCTRFVVDHYQTHGAYAFTWGWWLPRQLSLQEFRFGSLEYELIESAEGRSISIHIPADADLSTTALRQSCQLARRSIAGIAPAYADAAMYCDSWMLSPVLDSLLPADSRILAFKACFDVLSVDPASPHAARWIFGRYGIPPAELPEATSLQRRTKALMLTGGSIGSALGKLRDENWATVRPHPR